MATKDAPSHPDPWKCSETNPWTPILPEGPEADDALLARLRQVNPRQQRLSLSLQDVDKKENARVADRKKLVFHAIGCSGDPDTPPPQDAVAAAMARQLESPCEAASFLYHLGDIAYKLELETGEEQPKMGWEKLYKGEFYKAYEGYDRPIFAIPGNHDGKYKIGPGGHVNFQKSGMWHFLSNFCDSKPRKADDNPDAPRDSKRKTVTQPYPFWVLETPAAFIIGLYTNVLNGGALDLADDGPERVQYDWLVSRLRELTRDDVRGDRAVLLALHYPPFSGTPDFLQRGDPQSPKTPGPKPKRWLWQTLLDAFEDGGLWPDAVLAAHEHLYQRITYRRRDGRQIPFLVIGGCGHAPVEKYFRPCDRTAATVEKPVPFDVVLPVGAALPEGDTAQVIQYNDQDFGFVRITVDGQAQRLVGEFFGVYPTSVPVSPRPRHDVFVLDLATHRLL